MSQDKDSKSDSGWAFPCAVLALLFLVVCVASLTTVGQSTNTTFSRAASSLGGAGVSPYTSPPSDGSPGRWTPPSENQPPTETYARIQENQFKPVTQDPLSTFSVDVDTASYSNVRRYLREGSLPPKDAVRIEELVNYFAYNYPEPTGEHPVAVLPEVADCPWKPGHQLVRLAVQARHIDAEHMPPRNLVFLVDVSGSMSAPNRLPLVKTSLRLLVDQLTARDRVAIVVYAGEAGLWLPATPGDEKSKIITAINRLNAEGSTNGGEGIVQAYRVAQQNFIRGGVNRVILATDGDFNVGLTSEADLLRLIEDKRKTGVFLTCLGYGMGNYKDATIQKLADHGNGHHAYIDTEAEARKVFVDQGAALAIVAKDVKIQVEFNPRRVESYRLIGYEKRLLRPEDFNNDRKDAGDMGAGHQVTALYEIVPGQAAAAVDPLKYQEAQPVAAPAAEEELLTVKLRYKDPDGDRSRLLTQAVTGSGRPLAKASADFRFAAAVAGYGMILRDSPERGNFTFGDVRELAKDAIGLDGRGYRAEFLKLVERAQELGRRD